jgi:hypothetical protein
MTSLPPAEQPATHAPLEPRAGDLYVVRWVRADGNAVKHRYYRRFNQAANFLARLQAGGWEASVYVSRTAWTDVTEQAPNWQSPGGGRYA